MKGAFLCKVPYDTTNQISKSNELDIYAGDKSKIKMMNDPSYKWEAAEAYIMEGTRLRIKNGM